MRAAAILGLGTSPADLQRLQESSPASWVQGLPASPADADAIVIFGGDGTIHRHLAALVRLQLPVLVVPAGSGNDFARALNLHSIADSQRAWRDFESGKNQPHLIDLGLIRASATDTAHYFCCVAGCGLDAVAARRANQMPRWLRSHGGYALALLPSLLNLPSPAIRVTVFNADGENREATSRPTLLVAFANTQFFGDGMRIAPQADYTDGLLDVCRISPLNPLNLLYMFPTVYFGRHLRSPKVEYSRVQRVRVETDTPLDIYADGEFVCETPAEISVAPGALRVIA
jgi:diacylglycerol kinase (ATP)